MAGSTDESFRARVEKIFGSLAFSPASSSSSSPATWSLVDGDVEKREWRRDKSASDAREETPCSSSFDELLKEKKQQRSSRKVRKQRFEDDLEDLGEDDDDEDDQMRGKRDGDDDDEGDDWDIRSSIGLDRTLDDEEEEDEFDKVASGRENAGERLYMKDVRDEGSSLGTRGGLPNSSHRTIRDPRANHYAAKIRLKEDEAEAPKVSFSDDHGLERKEPHQPESSKDVVQPKPILKRKDDSPNSKPNKRVRFDLGCRNNVEEATEKFEDVSTGARSSDSFSPESESLQGQTGSQVPDYLLNPSRYTRYRFDSPSDIDEKSNSQACMDFLKLVKGSKSTESESDAETASVAAPKRVTFIPQKKAKDVKEEGDTTEVKENGEDRKQDTLHQGVSPMGIAAGEAQDGEADATGADNEAEMEAPDRNEGFRKPSRHYRAKTSSDETDT